MKIDARVMRSPEYREKTLSGAVRQFLDDLPVDGPIVIIDGFFDGDGAAVSIDIFRDVVKRVRLVGERFKTKYTQSGLGIWRERNASVYAREFSKAGAKPKWPLSDMDVGQSVEIRHGDYGKSPPQTYAHSYGRQSGKKFKTERIKESAAFRITRIA